LQGKPTDDPSHDYRAEVGLLLLLLKDLWMGDLTLGGTSSIGRGRLRGISALLCDTLGDRQARWSLLQQANALQVQEGTLAQLDQYMKELHTALQPTQRGGTIDDGTQH
ncbi:MAG: hypothetical protein M3R61_19260, partial [Chloroflexota bacterium]|nr:hypothetical protein [Chloroflexota bacterium]